MPCTVHHRCCCRNAVALAIRITLSSSSSCRASWCCPSRCHASCVVVTLWHWPSTSCHCHCHHCRSHQPLSLWSSPGWHGHIVVVALAAIVVAIVMPGHCIVPSSPSFLYCHCHIFIVVVVMSSYWCAWRFIQVAGCCGCGCVISSAGRSLQVK